MNVVMLCAVMLSVRKLIAIMLSVNMLSVLKVNSVVLSVVLSMVAPLVQHLTGNLKIKVLNHATGKKVTW